MSLMTMRSQVRARAPRAVCAISLVALALAAPATASVTVSPPLTSLATTEHWCPAPGGGGNADYCRTTLMPLTHIPAPGLGSTMSQRMTAEFPGWSVGLNGTGLGGTIGVSTYDAELCNPYALNPAFHGYAAGTDPASNIDAFRQERHCSHGAEIVLSYTAGALDGLVIPVGAQVMWIQIATFTGPYCMTYYTSGASFIDHGRNATEPFYWSAADRASLATNNRPSTWFLDAPENGCAYAGDQCGLICPGLTGEHWQADFNTYLAVSVPGSTSVTIFDGVHWGFTADCFVPAPGSAGALIGAGILATRRRRPQHHTPRHG